MLKTPGKIVQQAKRPGVLDLEIQINGIHYMEHFFLQLRGRHFLVCDSYNENV